MLIYSVLYLFSILRYLILIAIVLFCQKCKFFVLVERLKETEIRNIFMVRSVSQMTDTVNQSLVREFQYVYYPSDTFKTDVSYSSMFGRLVKYL